MLSFEQYRRLSAEAKTAYVSLHGTYLANRYCGSYCVWLYHLGSFFCEAWVSRTQKEEVRLVGFTDRRGLLAYAELVCLPPHIESDPIQPPTM